MKTDVFSMHSFKVLGKKPYNEEKKKVVGKSTDAAIWRWRKPGVINYCFGPIFGEIFVTDDCATGMFEGLSSNRHCAPEHSGKML